jgi:nucleoside-diphosphate-sugar epimerase
MRVVVAGAAGVLGRTLVPLLLARGHTVRPIACRASIELRLITTDLLVDDLVEQVRGYEAVIHIATADPPERGAPGAWGQLAPLHTVGTQRLLDAALASGVPRYIHQSIVMAYRGGGDAWLDEEAPLDDSPERATMCRPVIEMERAIRDVDPLQLAWTILRGGTFVGGGSESALIDALRLGETVVAGDGSNFFSPVNILDMASAMVAALELAPSSSTVNVVDEPLRYGDYVDALADLIGVARPRRAPRLPLPPSWRCTNEAAQTVLGWTPRERIWPSRVPLPSSSARKG